MSRREELLDLDEDLQFRKLELFRQEYMTEKEDLLRRISDIIKLTEKQVMRAAPGYTRRYLQAKQYNLQDFRDLVKSTPLFKAPDWWCYEFVIGSRGIALYLRHVSLAEIQGEENNPWIHVEEYDASFQFLMARCEYLTAEEFSEIRGVAASTVRVWIRRGKIRTAMKMGNKWMIPQLTAPFKRGFTSAKYEWRICLVDVPEGFEAIRAPGKIAIQQMESKRQFLVRYDDYEEYLSKEYTLNGTETEKLELYLIANPFVEYIGEQEVIRQ